MYIYVILESTLEVPNVSDLPEAKFKPHSLIYERPKIMFLFCRLFIKGQSEICFFFPHNYMHGRYYTEYLDILELWFPSFLDSTFHQQKMFKHELQIVIYLFTFKFYIYVL